MKKGGIFLQGHTHVPMCEERGGILCLNPGSVSIPKNGSERGYIVYESNKFTRKSLDGGILSEHTL